ncbi:ribulose-phosphate 3-epimerase [Candidatus Ishikawella capsulata]|uniref:Ribulose-phosphate 3-epimerase n=1 Tax=Candidatus Ishikawaella capsulata Mpkobe TaxID=476281 RepID=C5WDR3_9ENTR|nr:ribulose-phosphate 3-epimerase [Candidatus Ishikawaella capsulata]BAH83469.1 ribulose-phosphate 3-epimerase [Candidatus Ishikawaella capsulata Mpkobe]
MKHYLLAPSILSANFASLGEDITKVITAGGDIIHFDVMDNHYVPNLTMGPMILKSLINYGIRVPFDVHLMIKPVDNLIPAFAKAGATYITFHPEASDHIDRTLQIIREHGCKSGLVLNPTTSLDYIEYIMDKLDIILLMSVNPGFGNQKFLPNILNKLCKLRKIIDFSGYNILIEIDGGVKIDNIRQLAIAGADIFVIGSAIFNNRDYKQAIDAIRKEISI